MTMTEILQCFPEMRPGETPPDYVHRLHESGMEEKMLKNVKISRMVALNKDITLPKTMTLWDVKQVKSLSLGKNRLDELKQKCAEEVIQGKSTLCLAIASLEEAGASDLQMEDFLIQLPGGESLAIIWRTGGTSTKDRAVTEWELKRQFREEKRAKKRQAGQSSSPSKRWTLGRTQAEIKAGRTAESGFMSIPPPDTLEKCRVKVYTFRSQDVLWVQTEVSRTEFVICSPKVRHLVLSFVPLSQNTYYKRDYE